MLLGPTHEELFTLTVKGEYSSYKDFPLVLYQIQNQVPGRGAAASRHPASREFVMKDSYSFDIDDAGLKAAYHAHREAYQRIFDRLQRPLRHRVRGVGRHGRQRLRGVSGRKPGRRGHLRAVPGVRLRGQRRGGRHRPPGGAQPIDGLPEAVVHDTGDTPTIATLVDWANEADLGRTVTAADTLKNVLVKVRQPGG